MLVQPHPESKHRYSINEIFYSIQGEGVRAGTPNVFIRFAGCNLRCSVDGVGFNCDTDHAQGDPYALEDIIRSLEFMERDGCRNVVLTGGEPTLQVDGPLVDALKSLGWFIAIETNGTRDVVSGIDWITVSPKVPEDQLVQLAANEVKYVIGPRGRFPESWVLADHYLISPAFNDSEVEPGALNWCVALVMANPGWRLSVQQHKAWRVR